MSSNPLCIIYTSTAARKKIFSSSSILPQKWLRLGSKLSQWLIYFHLSVDDETTSQCRTNDSSCKKICSRERQTPAPAQREQTAGQDHRQQALQVRHLRCLCCKPTHKCSSSLTLQILLSSVSALDFLPGFLSCWYSDLTDSWQLSAGAPSLDLSSCCRGMKPCELAALTALGIGRAVCTGLVPTTDGCLSLEATPTTGIVLPAKVRQWWEKVKKKTKQEELICSLPLRLGTKRGSQSKRKFAVASQTERKAAGLILWPSASWTPRNWEGFSFLLHTPSSLSSHKSSLPLSEVHYGVRESRAKGRELLWKAQQPPSGESDYRDLFCRCVWTFF